MSSWRFFLAAITLFAMLISAISASEENNLETTGVKS